jgi:hypothetical protein
MKGCIQAKAKKKLIKHIIKEKKERLNNFLKNETYPILSFNASTTLLLFPIKISFSTIKTGRFKKVYSSKIYCL